MTRRKLKRRRTFTRELDQADQHATGTIRTFAVKTGIPAIHELVKELNEMTDVLLGRTQPPIEAGVATMLEVADAYYSRGMEMTILILRGEREGLVSRGSPYYKFRTGELRSFLDMVKRNAETGSRRLTYEGLRFEQQKRGLDSAGGWEAEEDDATG